MSERRNSFVGIFEVTDRETCRRVIRNGGIAALVSAGITLAFATAGFFTQSADKDLDYLLDPWLLIDVVLILVLAVFVFLESRVASKLLFVYFIGSKLMMWIELGAPRGLLISILFILYYGAAMRGTYLWHSRYRAEAAPSTFASPGG